MNALPPGQFPGEPQEVENANDLLAADESGYTPPDVEQDQEAIQAQVVANLSTKVNGWQPHDGNLDTWLIESFAEVGAEIRSLAADVPASIFSTYGTRVLGLPPRPATAATGVATFTAIDDAGYTLDIGSTFGIARSGNDIVAFQTIEDAIIPVGETSIADVPFVAVELGAEGNGLLGEGNMLDPVTWVAKVEVAIATSQGEDEEEPDEYVDRLANLFPAVALRPILAIDFAVLAMQLIPGVGRAVALNLFNPTDGTWTNARTVTLVTTDAQGEPCGATINSEVVALLDSLREVNWVIHVIDADYVNVDVDFTVVAYAGQSEATVREACLQALNRALSPAAYRLGEMSPAIGGGEVINPPAEGGAPARRQTIHINDLVAILDRCLGVDFIPPGGVTINGKAEDFEMANCYTLPRPGTITGTVQGGTA